MMGQTLSQRIEKLEVILSDLDKTSENYIAQKEMLLNEISNLRTMFYIGCYKKIDQMERKELLNLAFSTFDEKVLKIDYRQLMVDNEYIKTTLEDFGIDVDGENVTMDNLVKDALILFNQVVKKLKLETDIDFLRNYIKELVVGPTFIKSFVENTTIKSVSGNITMQKAYDEMKLDSEDEKEIQVYILKKVSKK